LIFDLFFKPTFSGRYLNFKSHHPKTQKRGLIFGLVDRIIKLSNPIFHKQNLENIIKILLNNGYPLPYIFSNINKRIKHILDNSYDNTSNNKNKNKNKNNKKKDKNNTKYYIKVPFIKNVTPKILSISNKHNFNTIFTMNNKLSNIIKTGKDKIEKWKGSNVVYKINCEDCDASYVGQTKRQLQTRINEHRMDINKRSGNHSVISLHQLTNNHKFDWNNVRILDREQSYYNRITSEMIHIKKQSNGLNKQNDTDQFPELYLPFI